MPRVILAEDSRTQAAVIRITLEAKGFEVQVCRDGVEALKAATQNPPDLVLTDLDMPEMDGAQLVKALKQNQPTIPAIIMHTSGSESVATAALRSGAVGYVMKTTLGDEIEPAYQRLRELLDMRTPGFAEPSRHVIEHAHSFVLDNEPLAIGAVLMHLQLALASAGTCDENDRLRVCIAARETIQNAMHNNLELAVAAFEQPSAEAQAVRQWRSRERPFSERRVRVTIDVSQTRVTLSIEDQGRPLNYPQAEAAVKTSMQLHRGLVLILNFMDRVTFEPKGNRLTLTNRGCDS